ncbi:MAG: YolD-like family protein [Ruminococcaceae bacterium]|nr:YolD-like family protein [Oscillospiraceae bacterium]
MNRMGKYDAIINLPHHQSKKRKHMSMTERAAQFGAFKALRGHEDALMETARHTDKKPELDEYTKARLNNRLVFLADHLRDAPEISITYFKPDDVKQGGAYITVTGSVKRIKELERMLVLGDQTEVPIEDILEIESELLDAAEEL